MQMEQSTESLAFPDIHCRSLYTDKQKPWRFELLVDVEITLSTGESLTIPAGYKTDFATIPRLFRGIVWGSGNHNLATLIHDWLYDNQIGTRLSADREMLYWLKKAGCSNLKAYTMYYAVRVGGRSWWNK
jgi:hypothetical protein